MKYFFSSVLMSAVLVTICLADGETEPALQITVTIEVANGTPSGSSIAGDEVTLLIYKDGKLLDSLKTKADAAGKAVFENILGGEHIVVVANAMHQDMKFGGRPFSLERVKDVVSYHIHVFDVSDDKSKLSIGTHHFVIKARGNALEVTEHMQLKNSSDMAITSEQKDSQDRPVVLEVMLPFGFGNLKPLSYFQEDALVITDKGFYDTMAVPPGEYNAAFSYTLDINSNTMDITKEISLLTSGFVVLAELGSAKLEGLGTPSRFNHAHGAPMKYYKRSNLAPSERIVFQITGFNIGKSLLSSWAMLAGVFSGVMVLVALQLWPPRKTMTKIF